MQAGTSYCFRVDVCSVAGDVSADEDDPELLRVGLKVWTTQGDHLTADDE